MATSSSLTLRTETLVHVHPDPNELAASITPTADLLDMGDVSEMIRGLA
jgi:hypothetical protein